MKAHLLVFDGSQVTRDLVLKKIDRVPEIVNWYAFFDNTICLASELSARELAALFREDFPQVRFLITETEPQKKGGWLPKGIWSFLNRPKASETSAA